MHLLFVCTGNICRSPTAERLSAAYAGRFQIPDFGASSVGTRVLIAHAMHQDAAAVLEQLGGDASGFAARQFKPKIAADADLVITMMRAHRDTVLERTPRLLRRTFTLTEASRLASEPEAENIADPSGPASTAGRAPSDRHSRPYWPEHRILCRGWISDCRPFASHTRGNPTVVGFRRSSAPGGE